MRLKLLIAVLSLFGGSLLLTNGNAHAVSGTCFFGGGTCSVSGVGSIGTNDVLEGRPDHAAIGNGVSTKNDFIRMIKNRFDNGGQDKTGASFIIQEMLGRRGRATRADLNEWEARMNSSRVQFARHNDFLVKQTSWYVPSKNDVFYATYPGGAVRDVIEITVKGKSGVTRIEYLCGNLVANPITLPPIPDWKLGLSSNVSPTPTIHVGQTINWSHSMTNQGPDRTDADVDWAIQQQDGGGWSTVRNGTWGSDRARNESLSKTWSYITKVTDIGKTICQRIVANPYRDEGDSGASAPACTRVISVFSLEPSVSVDGNGPGTPVIAEPGAVHNVTGTVAKSGDPTPPIQWQLSEIVVAPGGSIVTTPTNNTLTPVNFFGSSRTTTIASGSQNFTAALTSLPPANRLIDLPVGTRVCWALSVQPRSNTTTEWRHSTPVCIKLGKKPKLQILGGDLRTRGNIGTSTSRLNTGVGGAETLFGSWVEFGVFSVGTNKEIASGAGLRGGSPYLTQNLWSDLTFANVNAGGSPAFGNFGTLPEPPKIAEYFTDRVDTSLTLGSLSAANGVYKVSGLTVGSNVTIPKGKSVVVVSSGPVNINANIVYEDTSMSSLSDIPQLIIIAPRININANVDRVDAWLLASEWVNTCAGVVTIPPGNNSNPQQVPTLKADVCNKQLLVNGPVAAHKLYLYRTAGAGSRADAATPAETLNFRPDALLWAYNYGLLLNHPRTANINNLPPRF